LDDEPRLLCSLRGHVVEVGEPHAEVVIEEKRQDGRTRPKRLLMLAELLEGADALHQGATFEIGVTLQGPRLITEVKVVEDQEDAQPTPPDQELDELEKMEKESLRRALGDRAKF
jgi:hypothetical protein